MVMFSFPRAPRGPPKRLLPSLNASREETSRSRQVVLNAQRHLCPVEDWGSLILW